MTTFISWARFIAGFGFSFLTGLLVGELHHMDERQRLQDRLEIMEKIVSKTTEISERSLNYALSYQETLNLCLARYTSGPARTPPPPVKSPALK